MPQSFFVLLFFPPLFFSSPKRKKRQMRYFPRLSVIPTVRFSS